MKHLFLLSCACITALSSFAAIFIVDNNPNSTALYTTIPAAIAAASPGDTIYVQGSTVDYTACLHNLDKKIVLLGPGHMPGNQTQLNARLTGCGPSISFAAGSSGTVIMGFWMQSNISATVAGVDSLIFKNNYIGGLIQITGNNHLITGNIIQGYIEKYGAGGTNVIISNNIIGNRIQSFNSPTVEITNNVFLVNANAFLNVSNAFIRNNIFLKANPAGTTNATFLNNITYQTTDVLPTAGNSGSGNINNTDPQFVNVPTAATQFAYAHDYNLQGTSPGINAGSDGTDIGVFGGMTPFKPGGEPALPVVRSVTISNPVVPPGTDLNVTITAETQD